MPSARCSAGTNSPRSASLTTRPPMEMRPPVFCSRPATMRKVVVLPQPEGPSSVTNSPSLTRRSTPLTAANSPNLRLTFSRTTLDIARRPLQRAEMFLDEAELHPAEQDDHDHRQHLGADGIEQYGGTELAHDAEEHQYPAHGKGRPGQRDHDPPHRREPARAMHARAFLDVKGELGKRARHHPHRKRRAERDIGEQ